MHQLAWHAQQISAGIAGIAGSLQHIHPGGSQRHNASPPAGCCLVASSPGRACSTVSGCTGSRHAALAPPSNSIPAIQLGRLALRLLQRAALTQLFHG
jgi:hypothetical protein